MIATWPVLVSACSTSATRGATAASGSALDSLGHERPADLPRGWEGVSLTVAAPPAPRSPTRRRGDVPSPEAGPAGLERLGVHLGRGPRLERLRRGRGGRHGRHVVQLSPRGPQKKWRSCDHQISCVDGHSACACRLRTSRRPPTVADAVGAAVGAAAGAAVGAAAGTAGGCGGVCDVGGRCVLRDVASG